MVVFDEQGETPMLCEAAQRSNTAEARVKELEAALELCEEERGVLRGEEYHNANVGIRHTEYEGENETPFGIALDGMGDEVEA